MPNVGGESTPIPRIRRIAVCDLDGTLVDSDAALADAFLALGVQRSEITHGHVLAEECLRLGISVEEYLSVYDPSMAAPFPGVSELVNQLSRWAVCSNKHPDSGAAELARFGWSPEVAFFADSFNGPKRLEPVLDALGLPSSDVVFLGDTAHDRLCAKNAGVTFVLAGWNPRAQAEPTDVVLSNPLELLELLSD